MPSAERTFPVIPAPGTVLDYLRDFGRAEEWDPGTQTCVRNGSGPIEVGASWLNTSKFAGRTVALTYTLTEIAADHVVFIGKNEGARSVDTITVTPAGTGSQVTYHADLELKGAAKLVSPIVKVAFERLGNELQQQMAEVLNRLG